MYYMDANIHSSYYSVAEYDNLYILRFCIFSFAISAHPALFRSWRRQVDQKITTRWNGATEYKRDVKNYIQLFFVEEKPSAVGYHIFCLRLTVYSIIIRVDRG